MPKIIFTSRYMRDAPPEQLTNYVKYIGIREGVEKIDGSKMQLPMPDIFELHDDVPDKSADIMFRAEWSEDYKLARAYLYGSDTVEPDFNEAFRLFLMETESGNALAMHDLGRMFADDLGREIDPATAHEWYEKALSAFLNVEAKKHKPYLQYRIGKMYAVGLGTPQDYEQAASWFQEAIDKNHKYAQYSLAGLYYRG